MGTQLIHLHGLLATEGNFKEQEGYDFGVPQKAVTYWPFVEGRWVDMVASMTDHLKNVLLSTHTEDTSFVLHGNSAWWFLSALVATHPDMAKRISWVVLNCSAWLHENIWWWESDAAFKLLNTIKQDTSLIPWLIDLFVQLPQDKIPAWLVDEIQTFVLWENARENFAKIWRWWQIFKKHSEFVQASFKKALRELVKKDIPTLIIWWKHDSVTMPQTIQSMADMVWTSPVFFETGHAPHIQLPDDFNRTVHAFLQQHVAWSLVDKAVPFTAQ